MYITKVIEKFGDSKMVAKSIDKLSNKMYKEGFELITYQFYAFNEKIMLTFKKIVNNKNE